MMLGTDMLERVVGTVIVERLGGVEGTAGVVKMSGMEKVDGHKLVETIARRVVVERMVGLIRVLGQEELR